MVLSTVVVVITSLLSLRDDPFGVEQVVPAWVIGAFTVCSISLFVTFIYLLLWHYNARLNETLAAMQTANRGLLNAEMTLEARVEERSTLWPSRATRHSKPRMRCCSTPDWSTSCNRSLPPRTRRDVPRTRSGPDGT